MQIDFNGIIKPYKKGDGLWISQGENSKHKVLIEKGKHVELILFEGTPENSIRIVKVIEHLICVQNVG